MNDEKTDKYYAEQRITNKGIKEHVEGIIEKHTFRAKNFTINDMEYVDNFCKEFYDNNRKLMIMDLIRYKAENSAVLILDEKINFIYDELHNKIQEIKQKDNVVPIKKEWKGFGK